MHLLKFKSLIFLLAIISIFIVGCSDDDQQDKVDSTFRQYISGFTSGIISKKAVFRIRLSKPSKKFSELNDIIEDIFDFSPSVEGKACWVDNQTIDFKPNGLLESGTSYQIEFELGKVLDVEDKYQVFEYKVEVVKQFFDVKIENIKPYEEMDLVWNQLRGQ